MFCGLAQGMRTRRKGIAHQAPTCEKSSETAEHRNRSCCIQGDGQYPRFTGWLRANGFPTLTSGQSRDSLLLERRQIIQRRLLKEAPSSPHVLGDRANDAPYSAKAAYAVFLAAVSEAMHTEIGGHELQSIAFDVFTSLQDNGFSSGPSGLSQLLGTKVTPDEFNQLQQAHSALAAARTGLGLPAAAPPAPSPKKPPWKSPFTPSSEPLPFNARAVLSKMCAPRAAAQAPPSTTAEGPTPAELAQAYARQLQSDADALPSTFKMVAPEPPKPQSASASGAKLHGDLDRARGKMSLTTLERIVCEITGQSPPSRGGDETVLLLVLQTLLLHSDPDAAAGQLLEVLGFDHMDRIGDIVNKRDVRPPPPLLW